MSCLKFCLTIYCFFNIICALELPKPEDKYDDSQPEQIHLSLGGQVNEFIVTWVTEKVTKESKVQYGLFEDFRELTDTRVGSSQKFTDGGNETRTMWIHRVHLTGLLADSYYTYRCGSDDGWSALFFFKTLRTGTDWPVRLALYGDLGLKNPQSLSRLQLEAEDGKYDVIIHVGDFAYDMDTDNARVGDAFMNTIEPIAAYVPYMVCPGNHENQYNFSNYKSRFSMPMYEQYESMFYSWNLGPIHFISVNTEAYYYTNYGIKPLINMYYWLIDDLKAANEPEERSIRPWIILYGHRPMYCSNADFDDCTHEMCLVRVGLPVVKWFGMEELLAEYGVDLAIWAHEHSYERLWPIFDYQVLNGSYETPYINPRGPVHLTTGSAGNQERKDYFLDKPDWSAFRSNDYGYTRLTVYNETHLHWDQISDDEDGAVIDSIWLVKENHQSYSHLIRKDVPSVNS